jgi:pimeloyl-ACP methyl ester carboxylesterase
MNEKEKTSFKSIEGHRILKTQYDAILEKWPVPMERIVIPTDLGKTLCIRSRESVKPPMVLIHGSGSNSATWMADIEAFNEHYQTHCFDIPGDPGGSEDSRFSWNSPYFSKWLLECAEYLGIEKAVIGGLSLGGWATLRFVIDHPERVRKGFLLAPAGIVPLKKGGIAKMMVLSFVGKWGQDRIIDMLFQGKEVTHGFREYFDLIGRHFKYRTGNPPLFTDEELASVKLPIVVIVGKKDMLIDAQKTCERLARHLSDCRSLILDQAGHALIQLGSTICELLGH